LKLVNCQATAETKTTKVGGGDDPDPPRLTIHKLQVVSSVQSTKLRMEISTQAAKKTNEDFVSILLINRQMYEWMVPDPDVAPCKLYVLQEFSRYHERYLRGSTARTFWTDFAVSCVVHRAACCGEMTNRSIVRIAPLRKPQGCGTRNLKIAESLTHPAGVF